MSKIKQVIVVRNDLKMSAGKIAAQVAHASLKVFFDRFQARKDAFQTGKINHWVLPNYPYFDEWINKQFTKICLKVNSEAELDDLVLKAEDRGIHHALIVDAGHTVFDGVPTKTCAAFGPWESEELDKLTGKLSLLY